MSLIMDVINKMNHQSVQSSSVAAVPEKLRPDIRQGLESTYIPSPISKPPRKKVKFSRLTLVGFIAACLSLVVIWFATQMIASYWTFETNFIPTQIGSVESVDSITPNSSRDGGAQAQLNSSWGSADALQGILFDDENPICLIQGEVYKKGDTWNGNRIEAIFKSHVTLTTKSGRVFKLTQPR